jgi:hypothetical protein
MENRDEPRHQGGRGREEDRERPRERERGKPERGTGVYEE